MICIGKFVNTHGLKGEIKILSNFKYKEDVFKINNIIYIDNTPFTIKTYRKHQKYDMVTFNGFDKIEDVLKYKGLKVYIKEEDYNFSGVLNEKLIGMKAYNNNKFVGTVKNIEKNGSGELLVIEKDGKDYLIPYVEEFVKSITDKIELNLIKGLIDEN